MLADGTLLAQLGAPSRFTRLLVVFAFAQLFGEAAPFQKFFETAQGRTNRFPVVNAHSQRHASLRNDVLPRRLGEGRVVSTQKTADETQAKGVAPLRQKLPQVNTVA